MAFRFISVSALAYILCEASHNVYAKCDTEMKRKAIENAYPDLVDSNLPDWNRDAALLDWLSNLK